MNFAKAMICAGLGAIISTPTLGQENAPEVLPDLVVYSTAGLPADLAEALVGPFADYMDEKYSVPVNVQVVVSAVPQQWAAFQAEWPNPTGDVYPMYPEYVRAGIERGYWINLQEQYTPEEWARFNQNALANLDLQGYAAPTAVKPWVLAVQTSAPEDLVTSFADLKKPEVNRRYTFDSALSVGSGYNAIAAATLILGMDWRTWFADGTFNEEAARPAFELVASWAENALTLTQGSGTIRPLLQRGEALASAWWWDTVMEEIHGEGGAPIRVVAPSEGVVTTVQSGPIVSAASRNKVAAIEWVKFFHSDYATEVAIDMNYYSRLPKAGELGAPEWEEFAKSANLVYMDDFREAMTNPKYNRAVLDLYSRVVIQGQ